MEKDVLHLKHNKRIRTTCSAPLAFYSQPDRLLFLLLSKEEQIFPPKYAAGYFRTDVGNMD